MKKHLIAVAVAAAVAAPAAMADTTLYGLAHMSLDYVSADQANGSTGKDSSIGVSSNSSRLGVKGTEKISKDLSAIYQYEVTVGIDGEQSYGLFGGARNSFVGLAGGFGTVLMGIHDTPFKLVGRQYDLFGDQVGDLRNLSYLKGDHGSAGWDLRPQNVVAYVTPSMAGFSATLAYVTDHNVASDSTSTLKDNNDFDAYSLSAGYKHKMFDVAAAYEVHNIKATGTDSESAFRVGAGVNFAGVRVNAMYQKTDDQGFVKGAERDMWALGVAYKFGKNTVKAQYAVAGEYNDGVTDIKDSGANMWAIGYDFDLSKQTTLYAAYAATDNDKASTTFTVTGDGHGDVTKVGIAGGDTSAFSVGVKHKF